MPKSLHVVALPRRRSRAGAPLQREPPALDGPGASFAISLAHDPTSPTLSAQRSVRLVSTTPRIPYTPSSPILAVISSAGGADRTFSSQRALSQISI